MATKCEKCHSKVSELDKKCEHCGFDLRNWFSRHKIISSILGIILFFLLAISAGQNTSSPTDSSYTKSTSEITEKNQTNNIESKEKVQEVTQGQTKTINVSYDQMMNYLNNFFVMEKAPLDTGEMRYMGDAESGLAMLEIIGNKENITSTTLILGLPNDNQEVIITNSAILLRFLKNAVPEDENLEDWATNTISELAETGESKKVKFVGNKMISVTFQSEIGMLVIIVEHK